MQREKTVQHRSAFPTNWLEDKQIDSKQ